jgi:YbgC/YbaW family acyl-CoA thioester hydrolase
MIELGHPTNRRPPFMYAAWARVGFSDTDAQGVVYYGRYMPYFDLARTEYHRQLGRVHLGDVDFAMRATSVEYHAGARFDDLLEVFVRVARIGTTSITYEHAAYRVVPGTEDDAAYRLMPGTEPGTEDGTEGDVPGTEGDDGTLMATASATLVCIALDERRPVAVPQGFRERIYEFEGGAL